VVSLGVVIAGAAILVTGWQWFDPAMSLIIAAVIVWGTWGVLRDAACLSLAAVPAVVDSLQVRGYLASLPQVKDVHDLHIWAMSTTETAMTCHLVMRDGYPGDAFRIEIAAELQRRFAIGHPTVQIELQDAGECTLAPDHVI